MALDAQSAAVVAVINQRFPRLGTEVLDAAEARRILAENPAAPAPKPEVYAVEEVTAPGPGGDIRLRVYRPYPAGEPSPAIVFFHGGGFVICSLDTHDAPCRQMALQTGAVVVSVDYRMAPEQRYPAAAEDAEAATRWVADNAATLGIDPHRIAVAGDSAGGNLAAVVAQRWARRPGRPLAYQLLIYPMLDHSFDTESYRQNGHGYAVTIDHLRWYWGQYLGGQDGHDPMASPLRAADLRGLPPTYLVAAEHCPLRAENEMYAERLRAAGVPVTFVRYPGVAHGFFTLDHLLDTARAAGERAYAAVREALHG
jgi:acetyl esterase